MRTPNLPVSPRQLSRSIRVAATRFFQAKVRNALESAAEELEAQSTLVSFNGDDAAIPNALGIDANRVREFSRRGADRFCELLGNDIDTRLLFADTASTADRGTRELCDERAPEVSLISEEELELSVMVSTIAARYERRHRDAVDAVAARVQQLVGPSKADALKSVLGVYPVVNRFSTLMARLQVSVDTRVTALTALQFHVLDELPDLYQSLQKILRGGAKDPADATHMDAATPVQPPAEAGPQGLNEWISLLQRSAATQVGGRQADGPQQPTGAPLIRHLTQVAANVDTTHPGDQTLYDAVVQAMQRSGAAPAIEAFDLDVLRLVSLFFGIFLADEALSPAIRLLVGRLQIPVLRLALVDGGFFDQETHPARALIHAICRAGVGWPSTLASLERNTSYNEVTRALDELLDDPEPSAEEFLKAGERINGIRATREARTSKAEVRVVELEIGRAKLRAAKIVVQNALNRCLARYPKLPYLRTFFVDCWGQVLTFISLRHGCEEQAWRSALALCDEIGDMLSPCARRDDVEAKLNRVPHLLERLETHMADAGLSSAQIDRSTEMLYDEIQRHAAHEECWFGNDDADAGIIVEHEELVEPIVLTPIEPPGDVDAPVDDASSTTLELMQPGRWIRVRSAVEDGQFHQVKVAARVADTREILLVDERGAKWAIWREHEFADALEQGRVTPVDPDLLIQAALDRMIAQLTEDRSSEAEWSTSMSGENP